MAKTLNAIQCLLLPILVFVFVGADCSSMPTLDIPNSEGELIAQQLGYAIAGFTVEDDADAKLIRRDQALTAKPCPTSGTRTPQADGSMLFSGCEVFPGFVLDGQLLATETDEMTRLEADDLRITQTGFMAFISGFIDVQRNSDGSTVFTANFDSSSTLDGETDITNLVGQLTVATDGSMIGGFAMPERCEGTLDCASACRLTGLNIFELIASPSGFGAAFAAACDANTNTDCGFGTIQMLLINGAFEPVHILAPEETQSDATLLQPGGSRAVCVFFQEGEVINFRGFADSGGFSLLACPFTEFPTIMPLEGQIQFLEEPFGLQCNGSAFD